jgi:hypothetical protein
LPPRVRRGDRPAAATINGILDALGPRTLRIGRNGRVIHDSQACVSLFQDDSYSADVTLLPFDSPAEVETDSLLIKSSDSDSDTFPDTVTVLADGVYVVHISAAVTCYQTASVSDSLGVAYAYLNADTADVIVSAGAQLAKFAIKSGETEAFLAVQVNDMRYVSLSADDTIQASVGVIPSSGAYVGGIRLGVALHQLL